MATKRIILIRNAQPYDFGGGERFPVFVASILTTNGYDPLIISRSPKLLHFAAESHIPAIRGWWWGQQNWSGAAVLLLPVYLAWQALLFSWYLGIFVRQQPAAVHIQSKDDFIAATLAGRLVGARVIWTDHADLKHVWNNIGIWYKNPVGKLVYLCAHLAHHITVVSRSEEQLILHNFLSRPAIADKITVIYNGVIDTSAQLPPASPHTGTHYIVASRLVGDKGIGEVIDAFTIATNNPDDRLILLGDGPDAVSFRARAGGDTRIIFKGHQPNPLPLLAEADIFVHPTYHEGFSLALVEASMLSLPIIATNVGGNVEIIISEATGLLVPPKDIKALSDAMRRLAHNPTLRSKVGDAARQQYLDRFQFDRIVKQQFVPLYDGGKK